MSSITDRVLAALGRPARTPRRPRERGQVLVIFAFGTIGILAVAALVFDVGQNLFERRKQQDAADASALAGARWLTTVPCKASTSLATCPEAYAAAHALATTHGYVPAQITINIPPTSGQFAGSPGHIQVDIGANRGSYFAGVIGISSFRIAASAVAANRRNFPLPYSFLSLNETACKAGHIHGNGTMDIDGDVMVNSDCTSPGALSFDGTNAVVDVTGNCATVGEIDYGPSSTTTCGSTTEHVATPIGDPLAGLAAPPIGGSVVPAPPNDVVVTGTHLASNEPPNGCPGSNSPSTQANPSGCTIGFNRDKVVWIYPGVYYGGLKLKQTSDPLTVYMAPGIYYMAGGGFEVSGALTLRTVDAATVSNPFPTTFGGGVLIYNTDNSTCATSGGGCIKAIDFQNTDGGEIRLRGYTGLVYTGLVMWQDRKASAQPALKLTGNSAMTVMGAIYLPKADFAFDGNAGTYVLDAQVICDEFDVGGNGDLTVTYDPDTALKFGGAGLVQ